MTVAATATAFSTGAIINLGFAFVPILDKVDLILLMAFYGSIITLFYRIITTCIEFAIANSQLSKAAVERIHALQANVEVPAEARLFFELVNLFFNNFIITRGGIIFIVMSSAVIAGIFSYIFIPLLPKSLVILIAILIFVAAIGAASAWVYYTLQNMQSAINEDSELFKSLSRVTVATISLSLLVGAGITGFLYLDILKKYGPRVDISFSQDDTKKSGVILFQAADGFVMFVDGSSATHYIPNGTVKSVVSQ